MGPGALLVQALSLDPVVDLYSPSPTSRKLPVIMKQTILASALAFAGAVSAGHEKVGVDQLVSKRMAKRQVDSDGDYSMCKSGPCPDDLARY